MQSKLMPLTFCCSLGSVVYKKHNMVCIIRCKQFNNVTKLVEQTYKTLIEKKQIRAKLGGDNFDAEQSLSIPESYKNGLKYHRECYQKFTYDKTLYKRKTTDEEPCGSGSRKRKDLKLEINKKQHLFPDYCYFCKKNRITVNKKEEFPTKIVTYEAQ